MRRGFGRFRRSSASTRAAGNALTFQHVPPTATDTIPRTHKEIVYSVELVLSGNFEASAKGTRILAHGARSAAASDQAVLKVCFLLALLLGDGLADPERVHSHAAVVDVAVLIPALGPVLAVQARSTEPAVNANAAVLGAAEDTVLVFVAGHW